MPALIVIRLPGDHTADPRPQDGYPYRASYVADNDLALGRIIEFLSGTPIWKDSAVFVTEDDAQNGVDHVDAHRSVLLVASPWVKPGAVSNQHTSMGSITRTINELLGLGPMNLEDALAGRSGESSTRRRTSRSISEAVGPARVCPCQGADCEAEDEGGSGSPAGYGRRRRNPETDGWGRDRGNQGMKRPICGRGGERRIQRSHLSSIMRSREGGAPGPSL